MFGLSPKYLHEIEEMLAQPNCSVDNLLKCSSLTSQFRNGNKDLVDFLCAEKNSMRIIEIIRDEESRVIQKSILSLFQTSNTSLHRLFADNLTLTEFAMSLVESKTSHANFSIGIMSRIISRAFDLWPDDMSEIFRISETIYLLIIKHFDNECLFHTVQDLITDSHKSVWLLIWHLFRFLAGEKEGNYRLKHRKALIDNNIKVDQSYMTEAHKNHILDILRNFFKLRLSEESEFAENVTQYIIDQGVVTAQLLSVALSLYPNEKILNYAISCIMNCTDFSELVLCRALQYVAFSYKFASSNDIGKIFFLILMQNDPSNFVLISLKAVLRSLVNDPEKLKLVSDDIKEIIMVKFNRTKEDSNPLLFSFLIAFSTMLSKDESNDSQWNEYIEKVIEPWNNDLDYSTDFYFKIDNADLFEKYNVSLD